MILCLCNVDTLNICMNEFIIFVCTDSTEIFFSKLKSAGLNYNLPSFFTNSYCGGVSNKHSLLTFFIPSILGKGLWPKLGKMINLTSKLGEINDIEHYKGSKIYPQNQVILDCIMPSIPLKHKCLSIILI